MDACSEHTKMKTCLHRRYQLQVLYDSPSTRQTTGQSLELTVSLTGPIQETSGWLLAREDFDVWVKEKVLSVYDKKNLTKVCGHSNPSRLVRDLYERLKDPPRGTHLQQVELKWDSMTRWVCP